MVMLLVVERRELEGDGGRWVGPTMAKWGIIDVGGRRWLGEEKERLEWGGEGIE